MAPCRSGQQNGRASRPRLAPLRRGSLCATEEAPAKGLTHRGHPASQTRRLIVSGSDVPPSATFARRCFETSFGAFGSRGYGRERLGLVVGLTKG